MVRGFNLKLVAICLMMLFIFQIAFPTVSFALTGGPSQPEVQGFTPVGSSNLVDLSSGDFSYNIPLMTVPGPNGGYPINMGYKAGITMEQEASWVGLGWDLNVGSINRNLRGLPDDFNGEGGDVINKTISKRKNQTYSTKINMTFDKINKKSRNTGFEILKSKTIPLFPASWQYDVSESVWWKFKHLPTDFYDVIASDIWFETNGYNNFEFKAGVNYNFNTYSYKSGGAAKSFDFGLSYGSRDGLGGNFSYSKPNSESLIKSFNSSFGGGQGMNFGLSGSAGGGDNLRLNIPLNIGVSFAKSAPIGEISIPNKYTTGIVRGEFGKPDKMKYLGKVGGQIAVSTTKDKTVNLIPKAYGYLHSNDKTNDGEDYIQDFHQENQQAHYDYSPTLPLPVYDNDVYTVTGQGVGGAFRAYRNDVGMLVNNKVTTENLTVSVGGELGSGITGSTHFQGDLAVGGGESYSGPWATHNNDHKGNIGEIKDELYFANKNTDNPLYEPFYFDFLGNTNIADESKWDMIQKDNPILYQVGMNWKSKADNLKQFKTITAPFGEVNKGMYNRGIKTKQGNNRTVRTGHIGYKTKAEMNFEKGLNSDNFVNIYDFDKNPINPGSGLSAPKQIEYTKGEDSHLHEISVNNGGVNYVYGLPVYNTKKEEVYCSVSDASIGSTPGIDASTVILGATDASPGNIHGMENFYQSTKVGAYASTYMLTGTFSEDYVDLTGNGPTEDDLGYWCKFNYSKADNYQWRVPFMNANFIEGNYSDVSLKKSDDKASFSHGTREQYFVNSIETKTHIAIFKTSDREDNRGVTSRLQTLGTPLGDKTKKLDEIKLYSKNDPNYGDISKMVPIKTVVLEYDYSQCENTPNSSAATKGKLTLRKVYFTHQKNDKGSLTPYEFSYGGEEDGITNTSNPNYSYMNKVDRWGNYQTQPHTTHSTEFPYTNQGLSEANRKKNARAWNMTQISLPSGGKLKVDYEQDDYGYVQNKRATQMFKLAGFKDDASGGPVLKEFEYNDKPNKYLYFDTYKNISGLNQDELNQYKEGLNDLYFKAYVHLKKKGGSEKNEFIEGWATIDHSFPVKYISSTRACIKIKLAKYSKLFKNEEIHPIQKAAAQHIHQRGDLMPLANPLRNASIMINGPINFYKNKNNWCDQIVTNESNNGFNKVSLIRLNNPTRTKFGGGHRVASIKMSNGEDWGNWDETYGQKFDYINTDETSSGVADYEPIIGGEENAMKNPVEYNEILQQRSLRSNGENYVEKPYCEAYYPSPRVVYSRVITKQIIPSDLGISETISNEGGVTINEYYTAKDYPVYEKVTEKLNLKHAPIIKSLPIPFFSNRTDKDLRVMSQGYVVELNDMSGKAKAISTYDSKAEKFAENYKTKVEYRYHDYVDENNKKRLNNEVTILTDDAVHRTGLVGQKHDFYTYNHENMNWNVYAGAGLSIGNNASAIKYITPNVTLNRSLSQKRILVTNKVIYKTGLLKEVITHDGGKKTIARNLAYDAYTGEPIVQEVDNDWDQPIYTYNYSGHWKYPALKGKYNNYRAKFVVNPTGNANEYKVTQIKISNLLQVGDVLKRGSVIAYVTSIDDATATFKATKIDGTDPVYPNGGHIEIYESGYKNAQGAKVGKLVSLTNPLLFPSNGKFINKFITELDNSIPNFISAGNEIWANYIDACENSISYSFTGPGNVYKHPASFNVLNNDLHIFWPTSLFTPYTNNDNGPCGVNLRIINSEVYMQNTGLTSLTNDNVGAYDILKTMDLKLTTFRLGNNGTYLIDFEASGNDGTVKTYTAEIWTDCEVDCSIKGILHAEAVQLSDIWNFNYVDAGNPYIDDAKTTLLASALSNTSTPVNPYAYKDKGRWMPYKSWVYQTKRKQTGTEGDNIKIDKDGEYDKFYRFKWDWSDTYNQGKDWEWSTKMTKYSPYGYQVENENRLEIPSSELYGYNNSVAVAVAGNASYEEIAYDGFETNNYLVGGTKWKHQLQGHFTGEVSVTNSYAHTGKSSLMLSDDRTNDDISNLVQTNFKPVAGKEYYFSFWMLTKGSEGGTVQIGQNGTFLNVKQTGESGTSIAFKMPSSYATSGSKQYVDHYKEIDGWTKIEGTFTPTTNAPISMFFLFSSTGTGFTCIDDMRLSPTKSAIQTYVYDPNTLWLKAVLDYNNYATFYQRDNEGKLTVVKVETKKGIITATSTRENIVK